MINIGDILNDTYEIIDTIGSGGGGVVYKANHLRMDRTVIIKLIKNNIKSSIETRLEVDILKQLKHPYLPQVYDYYEDDNKIYSVMEFIEGQNLNQLISSGKKFTEEEIRKYSIQLCEAVEYLHNHNPKIIHSDIKPTNVMITNDGNLCLIDFNISSIANVSGKAYTIGSSKGYAAPEQTRKIMVDVVSSEIGNPDKKASSVTQQVARYCVDARSDIYGIGSTLCYMITSYVPDAEMRNLRNSNVSNNLKQIILKAMAYDPEQRYQTATDMKNDLIAKKIQPSSENKITFRTPLAIAPFAILLIISIVLFIKHITAGGILFAVLCVLYAVFVLINFTADKATVKSLKKQQKDSEFIKDACFLLKSAMLEADDEGLKKQIDKVYSIVHSSPMDKKNVAERIENEMIGLMQQLKDNVHNITAAGELARIIEKKINERNELIKLS